MYFEELSPLNEEHHVYVVRDTDDGRIYVKKILTVYDADLFQSLYENPVTGLPRIISISEDKTAGILTVVEEYISGKTIEEMIEKGHHFDENETVRQMLALCEIIKQLHSRQKPVIHRDIKPSNVILTEDGRIVLLDLNAGRFESTGASRDTRLIGTGGYAAPEQYGFGVSGPYTDIYGAGMLMKAMLTGDVTLQTGYDGSLKNVLQKCCAIDKEDRFQNVQQLMNALNSFSASKSGPSTHSKKTTPIILIMLAAIAGLTILFLILAQSHALNTHPEGGYFPLHETGITTPDISHELLDKICSSYESKNGSALTIKRDGSAIYYCPDNQYSEILCPWKYEDGVLTIALSKLHCEIEAVVTSEDFSDLIFCSDNKNWDNEEFIRLDTENDTYEKKAMTPYDKKLIVNKNGCIEVAFSDMVFEIPKHYCSYPRDRYPEDNVILVSVDTDKKEQKNIAFSYTDSDEFGMLDEYFADAARRFAADFMEDVKVADEVEIKNIGTHKTYSVELTGTLNKGFEYSFGKASRARVVYICDEENNKLLKIIMIHVFESDIKPDMAEFYAITDSAIVHLN